MIFIQVVICTGTRLLVGSNLAINFNSDWTFIQVTIEKKGILFYEEKKGRFKKPFCFMGKKGKKKKKKRKKALMYLNS